MQSSVCKLVLMPGMDGTGILFANFIEAWPDECKTEVIRYPTDVPLTYTELMPYVQFIVGGGETFVLVAESFSTPLAIQFAATNPPNLMGLILVAGFASSPVKGALRLLMSLLTPVIFRIPMPDAAVRLLLLGSGAPYSLLASVRAAISSVSPSVLAARFAAVLTCDVRAELSRVVVPVLYLRAGCDRLVGQACFTEIKRIKTDTNTVSINGPHMILQVKPAISALVISEFLRGLSKRL